MSSLFQVTIFLTLVALSLQQPPGVPPRQQNQPQHGQQQQQYQQQQPPQHQQQQQQQQQQQGGHGHGHHGKPLEFSSEVHNADHILEHLEKVVATKPKDQMSEEELEFHYFKLHDYDNNNKLDGVEIGKALTHFHDEVNKTDADYLDENGKDTRVRSDAQLSVVIDGVFSQFDQDKDGYIEYTEFKKNKDFAE